MMYCLDLIREDLITIGYSVSEADKIVEQMREDSESFQFTFLKQLEGKIIKSVRVCLDEIEFDFGPFSVLFYHDQDCCESVTIDNIYGDVHDLVGQPLLVCEERTSHDFGKRYSDSWTWTFYEFATIQGSISVKWYGESNGYYSESVDVKVVKNG